MTKLGTVEVWLIADYKEGGGSLYEKANIKKLIENVLYEGGGGKVTIILECDTR